MDRIITPQQIQKSVVKIVYKEKEQGTGFFITPNIILTTYHVFLEEKIEEEECLIQNFAFLKNLPPKYSGISFLESFSCASKASIAIC